MYECPTWELKKHKLACEQCQVRNENVIFPSSFQLWNLAQHSAEIDWFKGGTVILADSHYSAQLGEHGISVCTFEIGRGFKIGLLNVHDSNFTEARAMFKIEVFNAFQTWFGPSEYTSLKQSF